MPYPSAACGAATPGWKDVTEMRWQGCDRDALAKGTNRRIRNKIPNVV